MRKNFLMVMVAAVSMLFATSCQKEELGTEVTVSFALTQPGIATKAYSDGTTATRLTYAVYEASDDGTGALVTTNKGGEGNVPSITFNNNLTATVNLRLVTGRSYDIIFWADAEESPYTFNPDTKTVEVNYVGATSQDENRDAFFAKTSLTVTDAHSERIELKRPFAQLNIGTTDITEPSVAFLVPTKSSVKVSNVYSELNLHSGAVSGEPTEVTFGMAAFPNAEETSPFPVEGVKYLSMNYLLVATAEDQPLVNIEFTVSNDGGTEAITRNYTNVPVKRNYRTNIYGRLLTDQADYTLEIKPAYEEPDIDPYPAIDLGVRVNGKPVMFAPTVYGATESNPRGEMMTVAEAAENIEVYRLITEVEAQALLDVCRFKAATVNGVTGYNVIGNGNTIFLPSLPDGYMIPVGSNSILTDFGGDLLLNTSTLRSDGNGYMVLNDFLEGLGIGGHLSGLEYETPILLVKN